MLNAIAALAIAVLFAAGLFLLLKRDLIEVTIGTLLVSNAVILFIMSAGLGAVEEAIAPVSAPWRASDPLAQALALTSIVIGLGTTALLLRVCVAVERKHESIDVERIVEIEREEEDAIEPKDEA
jgi:multicomponent Na+:H+ antiporter subunit C